MLAVLPARLHTGLERLGITGGRRIRVFVFDNKVCSTCPLRNKCVRGNKPSTVTVGYYKKRMAAKERQSTAEFKEEHRQRARVERIIAWLTGHSARQACYIGRKKTRFQLQVIAAVCNIVALYSGLAAKAKLAQATAG